MIKFAWLVAIFLACTGASDAQTASNTMMREIVAQCDLQRADANNLADCLLRILVESKNTKIDSEETATEFINKVYSSEIGYSSSECKYMMEALNADIESINKLSKNKIDYYKSCDEVAKVSYAIFGFYPDWKDCRLTEIDTQALSDCLVAWNASRDDASRPRLLDKIHKLGALNADGQPATNEILLFPTNGLPVDDWYKGEREDVVDSIVDQARRCEAGSYGGAFSLHEILMTIALSSSVAVEPDAEDAPGVDPSPEAYETTGKLEEFFGDERLGCELTVRFGSLSGMYSPERIELEMAEMKARAETGSADEAYAFAWKVIQDNHGFFNPSNGEVFNDVDPDGLLMAAYFLAKASLAGHVQATKDLAVISQYSNAPDLAKTYLADNARQHSSDGFRSHAADRATERFTSGRFRALIAKEIVRRDCNFASVLKNARGADGGVAILVGLFAAEIRPEGQICVVQGLGRRIAVGVDSIEGMQCTDEKNEQFTCTGELLFSCETELTQVLPGLSGEAIDAERKATDVLNCGRLRQNLVPISAVVVRAGREFALSP